MIAYNNKLKSNYTQWKGFHHGQRWSNDQITLPAILIMKNNAGKSGFVSLLFNFRRLLTKLGMPNYNIK